MGGGCHKGMLQQMMNLARSAMGRARRGLYEGKEVRFGNNVSFSKRRTRRNWKPNAQTKKLWSDTLGERVEFKVTTHALRCINKAGGLDNYLVKSKHVYPGSRGDDIKQMVVEARRRARQMSEQQTTAPATSAQ